MNDKILIDRELLERIRNLMRSRCYVEVAAELTRVLAAPADDVVREATQTSDAKYRAKARIDLGRYAGTYGGTKEQAHETRRT